MTTFTKGGLRSPNTQSDEETMYANVTLGPKKAGGSDSNLKKQPS